MRLVLLYLALCWYLEPAAPPPPPPPWQPPTNGPILTGDGHIYAIVHLLGGYSEPVNSIQDHYVFFVEGLAGVGVETIHHGGYTGLPRFPESPTDSVTLSYVAELELSPVDNVCADVACLDGRSVVRGTVRRLVLAPDHAAALAILAETPRKGLPGAHVLR